LARALIVGCGCRGRLLGQALLEQGWAVRGTTRSPVVGEAIRSAGIEPAIADPDQIGTVLELVHDVAVVAWLLGSAVGQDEVIEALHGPRLEHLLRKLVDTPVRGLVYEGAGTVDSEHLARGAGIVRSSSSVWRMPSRVVDSPDADAEAWLAATRDAVLELAG
jgi:nucleoside-diphosphate-sugar epimerase